MDEKVVQILTDYRENKKFGMLTLLQEIQEINGFLTEETLTTVSTYLQVPLNRLYGVAAFYNQFRFRPLGTYHIRICQGTMCHMAGSSTYLKELEKQLKVKAGSTSRDRRFSLEIVTCLGGCEQAPLIQVNDTYHIRLTPDELTKIIRSLKEKKD